MGKYPSAPVLNIENFHCLIDCGEGAQFQMLKYAIPKHKIDQIFISHLHGDHVFGLIGLITSYHLAGRIRPLNIYSPEGLEEIIKIQLNINGKAALKYELNFHVVDNNKSNLLFENKLLEIYSIPLKHRVPTSGYYFKEKQRLPNFDKSKIKEFKLQPEQIIRLKNGEKIELDGGKVVAPTEMYCKTFTRRSYAYCSDTAYLPEICNQIKNVDLLYHEATFMNRDEALAEQTQHSTAGQAARIAKDSFAKQLVLGHFSSRYKNRQDLLMEALKIFPETIAAEEGMMFEI